MNESTPQKLPENQFAGDARGRLAEALEQRIKECRETAKRWKTESRNVRIERAIYKDYSTQLDALANLLEAALEALSVSAAPPPSSVLAEWREQLWQLSQRVTDVQQCCDIQRICREIEQVFLRPPSIAERGVATATANLSAAELVIKHCRERINALDKLEGATEWESGDFAGQIAAYAEVGEILDDLIHTKSAPSSSEASAIPSQSEREMSIRQFAAEMYQVCGALNAPAQVLDQLSAAARGEPLPYTTLLPFPGPLAAPAPTPAPDLSAILEHDRTKVAECITRIKEELQSYSWLIGSRGSYEWDDDKWHSEFAEVCDAIAFALGPMIRIAADWSNCPTRREDIQAARALAASLPPPAKEPK